MVESQLPKLLVGGSIPLSRSRISLLVCILLTTTTFSQNKVAATKPDVYVSPDRAVVAKIEPSGKEKGNESAESTVVINGADGKILSNYDFSSDDGGHGYDVDGAQWTLDSEFFVFRVRSSGGHSPMNAPVIFWSRADRTFYQLQYYTGDILFSVSGGDELQVSTWPGMKPAGFSLKDLKPGDAIPLKSPK